MKCIKKDKLSTSINHKKTEHCSQVTILENFGKDLKIETKKQPKCTID